MNNLSLYQTIKLLRKHDKLSERRSPIFEQNLTGKIFGYIGIALLCIYLIVGGTALGATSKGLPGLLFAIMYIVLPIDFIFRLSAQQTPAMFIKPYLLMPLSRSRMIIAYIYNTLTSSFNFIWFCLLLPYTIISMASGNGILTSLVIMLICWLLIVFNSQWYLLCRTLSHRKIWWWLLPIGCAMMVLSPVGVMWLTRGMNTQALANAAERYFDTVTAIDCYLLLLLAVIAALAVVVCLNYKLHQKFALEEVSHSKEKALRTVSRFSFLERFGIVGEYLKLEIKSTMRNMAIRYRFISGMSVILIFSLLLAFTDIYDNEFSQNFWSVYCFAIFGTMNITKIMCPEGNYIDLLFVHRESSLSLLNAKYYYYCTTNILPLIVLMIPVSTGKLSLLMLIAMMLFTTGPLYLVLFQLAIYNKQTLPLNAKITAKGNTENLLQTIISFVAFGLPFIFFFALRAFMSQQSVHIVFIIMGAIITLLHPIWMRNIYNRMMKRRYINLEGFHASR